MAEDFPPELENACKNFEGSMLNVEKCLQPILKNERSRTTRGLSTLDTAKMDLVSIYAMNSLYWSYLIMHGIDPKNHPIKQELDRIQTYMKRIEIIKNKENAPKLAKDAAKRFVRNAMFDSEQKNVVKKDLQQDDNPPLHSESEEEEDSTEKFEEDEIMAVQDSIKKTKSVDKIKKKKMKRKAEKSKKNKKKARKCWKSATNL